MVFGLGKLGILRGRGKPGAAKQAGKAPTTQQSHLRRTPSRPNAALDSSSVRGSLHPQIMPALPTPVRSSATISACEGAPDSTRIAELVAALRQHRGPSALAALTEMRQALASCSGPPPIQEIIALGGVSALVDCLARDCTPELAKLEAVWSLANIAAGSSEQTAVVIEAGAPEALFAVLRLPEPGHELADQCLWAFGNIAGDSAELRDKMLRAGVLVAVGELYSRMPGFSWDQRARQQVLRTLTWVMSALCSGSPAPQLEDVDCAFDYFIQVIVGTKDEQMICDSLWGLARLIEGGIDAEDATSRCRRLLSAGFPEGEAPRPPLRHPVISEVVSSLRLCGPGAPQPATPQQQQQSRAALRLVGALSFAAGADGAEAVVAAGVLEPLRHILVDRSASGGRRQEAAWVLSNVAASGGGGARLAARLLDEPGLWQAVGDTLLARDAPEVLLRECAWAVANVVRSMCLGEDVASARVQTRLEPRQTLNLLTGGLRVAHGDAQLQKALAEAAEAILARAARRRPSSFGGASKCPRLHLDALRQMAAECGLLAELQTLRAARPGGIADKKVGSLLDTLVATDSENRPSAGNIGTKL